MDQVSRLRRRAEEKALQGVGAAYPANQQLSRGLSKEEADATAQKAKAYAEEMATGKKSAVKEEVVIPPPDKEDATQDQLETAKRLLDLLPHTPLAHPALDPLAEDPVLRKKIEDSLTPIDIAQLLFSNRVRQTVSLFEGKLSVELVSLKSIEHNLLERWLLTNPSFEGRNLAYRRRQGALTTAALTIRAINGKPPTDIDFPLETDNSISPLMGESEFIIWTKLFNARLNWISGLQPSITDLLILNVSWFEQRIRRVVANNAYTGQEIKKS